MAGALPHRPGWAWLTGGAVDDQIWMTIVIHVPQGERDTNRVKRPRRDEVRQTSGKASLPLAVVDVQSPAVERGDHVQVTVVIEIPEHEVSAGHGLPQ